VKIIRVHLPRPPNELNQFIDVIPESALSKHTLAERKHVSVSSTLMIHPLSESHIANSFQLFCARGIPSSRGDEHPGVSVLTNRRTLP
jgi:hypothetical protein